MLRNSLSFATSPAVVLACGLAAVGSVILPRPREATPHERYLRDVVPGQSVAERRDRTRAHRHACPTCWDNHAYGIFVAMHDEVERPRLLEGMRARAEPHIDHFRGCPRCRAWPMP